MFIIFGTVIHFGGVRQGKGANHLGQILMDVRQTLSSENKPSSPSPKEPLMKNFLTDLKSEILNGKAPQDIPNKKNVIY